jgi:hypothetical protein
MTDKLRIGWFILGVVTVGALVYSTVSDALHRSDYYKKMDKYHKKMDKYDNDNKRYTSEGAS